MLFTTWTFAVFLGIVLILYYCLTCRWQNHLLLLASCVFYGWWDWRFLFLIFTVIIVNYLACLGIERDRLISSRVSEPPSDVTGVTVAATVSRHHKDAYWLAFALFVSLGQLAFFKYFNFFADSTVTLL